MNATELMATTTTTTTETVAQPSGCIDDHANESLRSSDLTAVAVAVPAASPLKKGLEHSEGRCDSNCYAPGISNAGSGDSAIPDPDDDNLSSNSNSESTCNKRGGNGMAVFVLSDDQGSEEANTTQALASPKMRDAAGDKPVAATTSSAAAVNKVAGQPPAAATRRHIVPIDLPDDEADMTSTIAGATAAPTAAKPASATALGKGKGKARRDTAPTLHPPPSIDAELDVEPVSLSGKGRVNGASREVNTRAKPFGGAGNWASSGSITLLDSTGFDAGCARPGVDAVRSGPRPALGGYLRAPFGVDGVSTSRSPNGRPFTRAGPPPRDVSLALLSSAKRDFYGSAGSYSHAMGGDYRSEGPEAAPPPSETKGSAAKGSLFSKLDPTASPWIPPWLESSAADNNAAAMTRDTSFSKGTSTSPAAIDGCDSYGSDTGNWQPCLTGQEPPAQKPRLLYPANGSTNPAPSTTRGDAASSSFAEHLRTATADSSTKAAEELHRTRGVDGRSSGGTPPKAPCALTVCYRNNPYTGVVEYLEGPGVISRPCSVAEGAVNWAAGLTSPLSGVTSPGSVAMYATAVGAATRGCPPGSPFLLAHGGSSGGGSPYTANSPLLPSNHYRDPLERIAAKRKAQKENAPPPLAGEGAREGGSSPSSAAGSGDASAPPTGAEDGTAADARA